MYSFFYLEPVCIILEYSFPSGSDSEESTCNAGDLGSIPGLGRSLGGGHGNPLQYSCLENPMDRGAWRVTVHGVSKSQTGLSNWTIFKVRYKSEPECKLWTLVNNNVSIWLTHCTPCATPKPSLSNRKLRNLYAGQEATVRTGHGTTDWFQIRKGVHQGCILPPSLFNLYAEYIMRNAGLEEAQAKIKIARRNINNLRYADDTTLMAESEEELRASWWKWKRRVKKLA